MKNKAAITKAIGSIRTSLLKGFALINPVLGLPEPTEAELPVFAGKILLYLEQDLANMEADQQYEGMSDEEIVEKKALAREKAIKENLSASASDFAALRKSKQPVPDPSDEDDDQDDSIEDDQDPVSPASEPTAASEPTV